MKKLFKLAVVLLLAMTMFGCSGQEGEEQEQPEEKVFKVAVVLPWIGDQSYFDTVNAGRLLVEEYENVETTLIEAGDDTSKWDSIMTDVAEGGYDLIISGNNTYEAHLYTAAAAYPDQLFFNFDYTKSEDLPNVYSVTYDTAELGYVAGTLASLITTSDMEKANPEKMIGVIVGMDIPAMNEFIGGFCQVATELGVQVVIGYPESFTDAAKGKEMSLNMIEQGVDVIWQVAGGVGVGVFEAAAEAGIYALGVDQDQYAQFIEAQPALAATIVASMAKNCDLAVKRAVDFLIAGEYPSGVETLGITENGVGLIQNDYYLEQVPEAIRTQVDEVLGRVASGEVEVFSVLANPDGWAAVKEAAVAAK